VAPEEVRQAVEEEIGKLRVLEPASSEYNVTRNYLDWLTSMPWGVFDPERFDIAFARECLDGDHYGLQVRRRGVQLIVAVAVVSQVDCLVCRLWSLFRRCQFSERPKCKFMGMRATVACSPCRFTAPLLFAAQATSRKQSLVCAVFSNSTSLIYAAWCRTSKTAF
jgi:hypothetical protein